MLVIERNVRFETFIHLKISAYEIIIVYHRRNTRNRVGDRRICIVCQRINLCFACPGSNKFPFGYYSRRAISRLNKIRKAIHRYRLSYLNIQEMFRSYLSFHRFYWSGLPGLISGF